MKDWLFSQTQKAIIVLQCVMRVGLDEASVCYNDLREQESPEHFEFAFLHSLSKNLHATREKTIHALKLAPERI